MSEYTVKRNSLSLARFADWLEDVHHITDVVELDVSHLRGWIMHLQRHFNISVRQVVEQSYPARPPCLVKRELDRQIAPGRSRKLRPLSL